MPDSSSAQGCCSVTSGTPVQTLSATSSGTAHSGTDAGDGEGVALADGLAFPVTDDEGDPVPGADTDGDGLPGGDEVADADGAGVGETAGARLLQAVITTMSPEAAALPPTPLRSEK